MPGAPAFPMTNLPRAELRHPGSRALENGHPLRQRRPIKAKIGPRPNGLHGRTRDEILSRKGRVFRAGRSHATPRRLTSLFRSGRSICRVFSGNAGMNSKLEFWLPRIQGLARDHVASSCLSARRRVHSGPSVAFADATLVRACFP